MVGDLDQVTSTGCLPDEHPLFVVLLQDLLHLVALGIDLIGGNFIFGAEHQQLIAAALHFLPCQLGNQLIRHQVTGEGVQTQSKVDAVHVLNLFQHGLDLLLGQVIPTEDHFHGVHIEFFVQLLVGLHRGQVIGQTVVQLIVDVVVGVAVQSRDPQDDHDDGEQLVVLHDELAQAVSGQVDGLVSGLPDGLIKDQDQGRQHGDTADDAQQDALGHDHAHIQSQGEAHEAQGDEASDGGQGRTGHRGDGGGDGVSHGLVLICYALPLFLVTAP